MSNKFKDKVWIIILIIGFVCISGTYIKKNQIINNPNSSVVQGVLVGYDKDTTKNGVKWHGVYEYTVNGEKYHYVSDKRSSHKFDIDSTTDIYYLESNPTTSAASIDSSYNMLYLFLYVGIIGIVIVSKANKKK